MCVCVCVCIYMCVYVCVCVHICVCMLIESRLATSRVLAAVTFEPSVTFLIHIRSRSVHISETVTGGSYVTAAIKYEVACGLSISII